jgi:hypothetical protein
MYSMYGTDRILISWHSQLVNVMTVSRKRARFNTRANGMFSILVYLRQIGRSATPSQHHVWLPPIQDGSCLWLFQASTVAFQSELVPLEENVGLHLYRT